LKPVYSTPFSISEPHATRQSGMTQRCQFLLKAQKAYSL
jgi:hypothetical protein